MIGFRVQAVSIFLENPRARMQDKLACERASMTVSMTCERRYREPLVARASEGEQKERLH